MYGGICALNLFRFFDVGVIGTEGRFCGLVVSSVKEDADGLVFKNGIA